MARILQIRRGTSAQNDNFTGLSGEISFDTDTKTLRVHDGKTLGGFALARADQIPDATSGDGFDITSVSDEFWAGKFAQFGGIQLESHTSLNLELYSTPYIEYIFNDITGPARFIRAELVCQTDAAGYAAGDVCTAFGVGAYACPIFNSYTDANGLHVRIAVGGGTFWVAHKSTGIKTNITNDDWRLKFTVYC